NHAEAHGGCAKRLSLQILGGTYYRSSIGPGAQGFIERAGRPDKYDFDYFIGNIRLGCQPWMSPEGMARWVDHWEFLLDLNVGHVFHGPSAIVRYNFGRGTVLVPYLQGAVGIVYNDAYKDKTQALIGQAMEFFLAVEGGIRWRMTECLSLDVEGGLQHISNAGLADRNGGLNTLGGSVGFTYNFGCKGGH